MKYVILLLCISLAACGRNARFEAVNQPDNPNACEATEVSGGVMIICGDTSAFIPNPSDGVDGRDGESGVILSTVQVKKNTCTKVYDGIWVENVQEGRLFDVYSNENCADNQGEFCDNVIPSYGRSGNLNDDKHPGSGTTCWAGNVEIQGHKQNKNDKDLIIMVKDFN